jgi:hypothetical protein
MDGQVAENQRHEERLLDIPDKTATTKAEPGPTERTYILRHRALEDAMVVAEQQGESSFSLHPWTYIDMGESTEFDSRATMEVADEGYKAS